MKLYEAAIIFTPLQTKEQHERGEKPKSKLIVPITTILASNDKESDIQASRLIPEDYLDKLECIEIALRPF
jgi:hypothetical protein